MKRKAIRLVIILVLVFGLSLSACNGSSNSNAEVKGFESPEELIDYFAEQIAKGDLEKASTVFAVELMAENYDLAKQIENLGVWTTSITMPYPSEDESFLQANKVLLKAQVMKEIANMCFSLNTDEEYLQQTVVITESGDGESIADSFLLQSLDSFKMTQIEYASPDTQDSEAQRAVVEKRNEVYGSDEFSQYVVYYEWNSQQYKGGVTFIKYGDLWYLYSLQSNLAGDSAMGYLEKVQ